MSEIQKRSLTEQVYLALRKDIIEQRVKCGEKLTIRALQDRFGVSSSPIREAMNRLYQDGLLEYYTNQGAKVIEIDETDIVEIYDFCMELDCIAIKFALRNTSFEEIAAELDKSICEQKKAIASTDTDAFKEASDEFHIVFYNHANNSRLVRAAEKIRGQFSILTSKYQDIEEGKAEILKGHEAIYQAIADQDENAALSSMREHFAQSKRLCLDTFQNGRA